MTNHELYSIIKRTEKCFKEQADGCYGPCEQCPFFISAKEFKAAKEKLEELIRTEDDLK